MRLTRSTFTVALKDSAKALSKHTPVAPTDRRMFRWSVAVAKAALVILGTAIGVEYRALDERIVPGGHGKRVDHQFSAEMIGHGVSDAGLGVTVDDGGDSVESTTCWFALSDVDDR